MKHTIAFENTPNGLVIEYSKDIPMPELWTLLHNIMKKLKLTEKQMLQIFNLDKIVQENEVAKNN